MTPHPQALVAAATGLIGCPFRLHGRDPATGLDCVGLVSAAMAATGAAPEPPSGYGLRNLVIDQWLSHAGRSDLHPAPGPVEPGDIVLIALPLCQHHLAICENADTVIHAHAGLGCVVRQPMEPTWRIAAKWRLAPPIEG